MAKKQIYEKSLTMLKTRKGDPSGSFNIHSVGKQQKKLKGEPLGIFFSEKNLAVSKKMKGGPFGLAGFGMLHGKREKSFWFSSLGQMVQFGAIIFWRNF